MERSPQTESASSAGTTAEEPQTAAAAPAHGGFTSAGAIPPVGKGATAAAAAPSASDRAFGDAHHKGHNKKHHEGQQAASDLQVMENESVLDGAAIEEASAAYGVPADEIRAVITQESRGRADANAGAKQKDHGKHAASGLMQVTAETWKQAQHSHPELERYDFATYRYDRKINILVGTSILAEKRKALVRMGVPANSRNMAALNTMAYNGGEGIVEEAYRLAVEGGSKQPDQDCLKAEFLKPAIRNYPEVYKYYLTGGGKSKNPHHTVDRAVELKFEEISKYPTRINQMVAEEERVDPEDGHVMVARVPALDGKPTA